MPEQLGVSADPAVPAVKGDHTGAGDGVVGVGKRGVVGLSPGGVGVWGKSDTYEGVHSETHSAVTASIAAYSLNPTGTGAALFAKKLGDVGHAGFFDGGVYVVGDVTVTGVLNLAGADYAESMSAAVDAAPVEGMVVVIDDDGRVRPCDCEYDSRVAGVVSGAGGVSAAVVLDRHEGAMPVAMMGKLWVLGDATEVAIRCGDVLTTSTMRGHARRVTEPGRAFGAVIGKALTPLASGTGLVRVLVNAG
jgi:hypothetical protein